MLTANAAATVIDNDGKSFVKNVTRIQHPQGGNLGTAIMRPGLSSVSQGQERIALAEIELGPRSHSLRSILEALNSHPIWGGLPNH